jgi:hypothetical protein
VVLLGHVVLVVKPRRKSSRLETLQMEWHCLMMKMMMMKMMETQTNLSSASLEKERAPKSTVLSSLINPLGRTPLLYEHNMDGRATLNLGMLEMDSDLTADVRRELEEEDLKFPPGNGSNSLVDEFENRMRSDNTGTPLGMASHFSPPPERPFKCDQCPQSFNRNHDLKRHKRIHVSVKPFPCGHCEKSFSRKDALKVHSSNSSP